MSTRAAVDAIALIEGAGGSWGTGFLVRATDGRLLVLTAHHVANKPPLTVRFAATGVTWHAVIADHAGAPLASPASDWAALACTTVAATAPGVVAPTALDAPAPLLLDELANFSSALDRFHTFGYPNLYGWQKRGGALHGAMRAVPGGGLEPCCLELVGRKATDGQGLSGAPFLVADVAVGLIKEVLADHTGQALAGTAVLVPARTIVGESRGAFALATDPELPYRALVEERLADVKTAGVLGLMANALGLGAVAGGADPLLRGRVVRGLLSARPVQIVQAWNASTLDAAARGPTTCAMLVLRESLWLHAATVRDVVALGERGGVAAFEAELEVTARQLLRRASWARGWIEHWHRAAYCVIVTPTAIDVAGIVDEIEREIANQLFAGTRDRARIQQRSKKRPLFVMIFNTHPRPALCAAITQAFGDVRVVFFSRTRGTELAELWWGTPLPADAERTWRDDCVEGRDELGMTYPLPDLDRLD